MSTHTHLLHIYICIYIAIYMYICITIYCMYLYISIYIYIFFLVLIPLGSRNMGPPWQPKVRSDVYQIRRAPAHVIPIKEICFADAAGLLGAARQRACRGVSRRRRTDPPWVLVAELFSITLDSQANRPSLHNLNFISVHCSAALHNLSSCRVFNTALAKVLNPLCLGLEPLLTCEALVGLAERHFNLKLVKKCTEGSSRRSLGEITMLVNKTRPPKRLFRNPVAERAPWAQSASGSYPPSAVRLDAVLVQLVSNVPNFFWEGCGSHQWLRRSMCVALQSVQGSRNDQLLPVSAGIRPVAV